MFQKLFLFILNLFPCLPKLDITKINIRKDIFYLLVASFDLCVKYKTVTGPRGTGHIGSRALKCLTSHVTTSRDRDHPFHRKKSYVCFLIEKSVFNCYQRLLEHSSRMKKALEAIKKCGSTNESGVQ